MWPVAIVFTSDYAVKNGRRYRYYVTRPEGSTPIRIPAADLEQLVTSVLAEKLRGASWVVHNLTEGDTPPDQLHEAVHEAASLANEVEHKLPRRKREVVHQVISRMTIQKEAIGIRVSLQSFAQCEDGSLEGKTSTDLSALIEAPAKLIRRGADPRLIISGKGAGESQINRVLVGAMLDMIAADDVGTFAAAAFADPPRFSGHSIDLASESLTMGEVAAKLAVTTGHAVTAVSVSEDQALASGINTGLVSSPLWDNVEGYGVNIAAIRSWGVPLTSFDQWAARYLNSFVVG